MLPVRYLFTVDRTALPDLIPQPLPCLVSLLQSLVQHARRRRDGSACAAALQQDRRALHGPPPYLFFFTQALSRAP